MPHVGLPLSQRNEDGSLLCPDINGKGTYIYYEQFFKYGFDALLKRHSFHAVDNTMITDILIATSTAMAIPCRL